MSLNAGQQLVAASPARFKVVIAGRRWGKTHLALRELAKVARMPYRNCWYIAPTYRMCKQILWEPLKAKLSGLNWVAKINESDLTITLRNGSRISLRGADNPDSLRGVSLDVAIFDEFAWIDDAAWTSVIRPTLSDRGGSAMFISTPMGRNWAYDLYLRSQNPAEHQWEGWQFKTIDGGNVPTEEIEAARQDLDARTFKQEYEATFEEFANRIYYAFDPVANVAPWVGALPMTLYIGMDFNVSPMTAAVFAQVGQAVHAVDEIVMHSSNTEEMVAEIKNRYPKQKIFVYPDPASRQRKTSAGGRTDLSILQNAGFVVKAPNSHNAVRDGINAVNSMLCNSLGVRRLLVDPSCRKTIESLDKFTYKEGTSVPDKDSGFDHMADAIRYYIDYVFPIRRDIEPQAPQRWGHNIGYAQ